MDDCFDDFHDDMDGCGGDDFDEGSLGEDGADGNGVMAESEDGVWKGPSWEDWLIIGPLAESLAREERARERMRRENGDAEDDFWDVVGRKW